MPYIIKNTEVRLQNIGTLQEPHLYAITSGQNNHASLLFHCKIENDFHTMWINKVNKTSCNMGCVEKGCKAKHKFCVDEKFVKTIIGGLERGNGKKRDKYYLDYSDPMRRDVTNWTVKSHNTVAHTKK